MNFSLQRLSFTWFAFWVALAIGGIYLLLPLRQSLRFGIDLVGGTYITLEVQTDKAIEAELLSRLQSIKAQLKKAGIAITQEKINGNLMELVFNSLNEAQTASQELQSVDRDLTISSSGNVLSFSFTQNKAERIAQDAVARNIEVLRARFGVEDIPVTAQGTKNIIIELPDTANPEEAKRRIGRAAILQFKLVHKVGRSIEDIEYEYDGYIPTDMEIIPGKDEGMGQRFYLVSKYAEITGNFLKDAHPQLDTQKVRTVIAFELTPEGGDKFYELTSNNIGKELAIVLDGVVICAPTIQAKISTQASITGKYSPQEAKELSLLLRSGSFVAPVTFEFERQIGPSLGAESIKQGLLACMVGLALLFVFSLVYYRAAGLFAFAALVYNLLLILIGMAWLKATLTLPGIAGMVLTIGMAIDASILIFEQIREALGTGMTLKKAIAMGFSDAMTVILDANITTFIVGIVLYKFGTGPIQGFAVTMMLGIISTLITGLFFLRALFNFVVDTFNVQKLKF